MVFHCQRECYDTELTVKALSCTEASTNELIDGKNCKVTCYETVFEDTVFFPEGGGQPYDVGVVEDSEVFKVLRKKENAIHYLRQPIETGVHVKQTIDWNRRYDHMQQHTGQHLITAIADEHFKFPTLSWNLGAKVSFIELNTPSISNEQRLDLEALVNEKIRDALPIITKEYQANDPELRRVRTRGLPDDVVGPVRVVTISGVESNMCCGTHLKNLSELMCIKLLYSAKGKKNTTSLYFIAGNRVLRHLEECTLRERDLTTELHSNPDDHVRLVQKCKKNLKECQKSLAEALSDIADVESKKVVTQDPRPKYFIYHRRDGSIDLLNQLIRKIDDKSILKILSIGEDVGPATVMIQGPDKHAHTVAKGVTEILDGKCGGKTLYTAKVPKITPKLRQKVEEYVHSYVESLGDQW